jgi:hypothetical protein
MIGAFKGHAAPYNPPAPEDGYDAPLEGYEAPLE